MIKTVRQTPGCEGCPMRRFNENFVSLQRPNPAHDLNRLVIAEAPGKQESIEGQPLVGGAGQVFDSLLEEAGIRRDGLTIIRDLREAGLPYPIFHSATQRTALLQSRLRRPGKR